MVLFSFDRHRLTMEYDGGLSFHTVRGTAQHSPYSRKDIAPYRGYCTFHRIVTQQSSQHCSPLSPPAVMQWDSQQVTCLPWADDNEILGRPASGRRRRSGLGLDRGIAQGVRSERVATPSALSRLVGPGLRSYNQVTGGPRWQRWR